MRLAFVVYGGLDELSGGFIYDRSLVAALRADGVEVDEVALPWPDAPAAAALQDLEPLPLPRPLGAYAAVIEDELCHPSLVRRNEILRGAGVPVVALVHNLGARDEAARALERRYLLGVDGVVAVCRHTLAEVQALCAPPGGLSVPGGSSGPSNGSAAPPRGSSAPPRAGGLPDATGAAWRLVPGPEMIASDPAFAPRTLVLPPGRDHFGALDVATVVARPARAGPLRVLFVGVLAPHKGLHRLIEAWPSDLAARLDVVGPLAPVIGPGRVPAGSVSGYVAELRAVATARGLGQRVTFHGLLRGAELEAAYTNADVLVLPSEREAYPLVVLEAMGFGVPSLVTSVGGADELVEDGQTGWLLNPTTPGTWIARLRELTDTGSMPRARLMGVRRAARTRHASHATWAQAGRALWGFLACLVAEGVTVASRGDRW